MKMFSKDRIFTQDVQKQFFGCSFADSSHKRPAPSKNMTDTDIYVPLKSERHLLPHVEANDNVLTYPCIRVQLAPVYIMRGF